MLILQRDSSRFSGLSDFRVTSRSPGRGGGCLAQGLTPGRVQGAEHSSTQHRPKLLTEIHHGLLLMNRHFEKTWMCQWVNPKRKTQPNATKAVLTISVHYPPVPRN